MHHLNRKIYDHPSKLLDQYYTKREIVRICLSEIKKLNDDYDEVIEPSAGMGAFLDEIVYANKIGMDIASGRSDILQQDWLTYNINKKSKRVLIVGNPPFGQYHKMSSAFIKHAISFSNVQTIGFILPNGYKKHTRQRILPKSWRIVSITDLPKNSFTCNGIDYHIPCSFFVFDKSSGKDLRVNPNLYTETKDFIFGDKNNFDIFVFGASPTHITEQPKPNNRGHYIKSKIPKSILINKITKLPWEGCSSASGGVYWLTKFEFLQQYIEYYGR